MSSSSHVWNFFRTGGLDQVALTSGADLLNLEFLDQKLWMALSCPVRGIELDEKTLRLIDEDGDGRIRVPEIISAIRWSADRLLNVGILLQGVDGLPLSAIKGIAPEGAALLASAKNILASLNKVGAPTISTADTSNLAAIFAGNPIRGDGVVSPAATSDPETEKLIKDIIACTGGTPDATGGVGVGAAKVERFYADVAAYLAWSERAAKAQPLGAETAEAYAALRAVRNKIDDFFARCRLAAFDPRALAAVNRSETEYLAIAASEMKITSEELREFPLAPIEGGRSLPIVQGVNPAWAGALLQFQQKALEPFFGADKETLTEKDWLELCGRFVGYETWMADKAGASLDKLGLARARAIAQGEGKAGLLRLFALDQAQAPAFKAIGEIDRLTHYHRDLRTLLHNFVNFADFYSRDRWAVFQAGTLYLDSRSTELCIRVDGATPLAVMSKIYIAYCALTRPGGQKMTIAACFTQGDSDYLFVGRHGVFYDRQGRDWDAVITTLVDNPVSIRQAFWAPYKKFIRMIEERVAKRAAAAEAASNAKLAGLADAAAVKGAEPAKVDVGAVAAIGVAITGAVSAMTLILGYIFQLKPWQYPLLLLAIMLVISLPSMVLAWLKLRQRTLGPILEGNDWAVNGRVKINLPFGAALTSLPAKPAGSRFTLEDPYEDKSAARRRRRMVAGTALLALLGAAFWIRWDEQQRGHYFWEKHAAQVPPVPETPAHPPAAAPAPAPSPKN